MSGRREARLHTFDEPEPAPPLPAAARAAEPAALRVSEVVAAANKVLQADPSLSNVWVRGEISSFTAAASGHWYITLKDDAAVLHCTMWRTANARVKFLPEEGMEVLVRGRVNVYAARSALQLAAEEIRPVGAGALQLAFEQLKRKLAAEGLFDAARKRELPEFPATVGIVTSLQAAALRDLIRVATTRNPAIRLLVADARVQGEGAAAEIAAAIGRLNADGRCDVLIVGRGGGSVEDLWAFNEEAVVRAICASRIPIVSAVGHETDTTLADFAADVRAPTPSAAAELVVPDAEAALQYLSDADERMRAALERLVPELRQRLDELHARGADAVKRALSRERDLLAARAAQLDALSPLAVLSRGYAVARAEGKLVTSVDDVAPGVALDVVVKDGTIETNVKGKRHGRS